MIQPGQTHYAGPSSCQPRAAPLSGPFKHLVEQPLVLDWTVAGKDTPVEMAGDDDEVIPNLGPLT
jgi:hypothetical protein